MPDDGTEVRPIFDSGDTDGDGDLSGGTPGPTDLSDTADTPGLTSSVEANAADAGSNLGVTEVTFGDDEAEPITADPDEVKAIQDLQNNPPPLPKDSDPLPPGWGDPTISPGPDPEDDPMFGAEKAPEDQSEAEREFQQELRDEPPEEFEEPPGLERAP